MPPSIARVSGKYKSLVMASSAVALSCVLLGTTPYVASSATTTCGSMTSPVFERVNPTGWTGSLRLDRSLAEADAADGFTSVRDTSMLVGKMRSYARTPVVDPTFSIAVIPDTQQEVLRPTDGRFVDRTNWLVANRSQLDLRYVTHTGDVVNWDTPDHRQYTVAQNAFDVLNNAGVPYSLSIGNHDTQATGVGGSARDPSRTHELQRDTSVFNRYFGRQGTDLEGAYAAGKVDNTFHIFNAGGKGWLVLNLELWPRKKVVAWAEKVVKTHPRHNVLVVTHAYLTASGKIGRNNGGYGDTSPRYLYAHLIGKYKNVSMVFSGHTGQATHRVDHGVHGNRIDSFLTTIHSNSTNPVRLLQINTAKGTISSRVYAPWTDETSYPLALKGLHWVG